MRTTLHLLCLLILSSILVSCEKSPIVIDFTDPVEVEHIDAALLYGNEECMDLIEAFGEENIHFGPVPPSLDGISFEVIGMDYAYCKRFIFDTYNNNQPIVSHAAPPTYDNAINFHHFFKDQSSIYTQHKFQTRDTYGDIYSRENDTVYVIGNGTSFTAYYIEQSKDEGSGNPTNALIISGTLVRDSINNSFIGIKDYRIGKKILDYEYIPTNAQGLINGYAPGTIEIKVQHQTICLPSNWDNPKQLQ